MNRGISGFIKNYGNTLLLLLGITFGSILGLLLGKQVELIKPLGDIFLNLLFTAVVPLIFFTIASSIANIERSEKLGGLLVLMSLIFLITMIVASFWMVLGVCLFPIHQTIDSLKIPIDILENQTLGNQIVRILTVNDFFELLSRKSMLALIIFSLLVGLASMRSGKSVNGFRQFLNSGNEVMKEVLNLIMKLAPIGLGAYFGYQIGVFGPELFNAYAKSIGLGYVFSLLYFIFFLSFYAFIAGGIPAIKIYWQNNIIPSLTALGTCSGIASIPANLEAGDKMKIPPYIRNVVIPLGSSLHKEGSSILSIIKIAVLFALFGKNFIAIDIITIAVCVSVVLSIAEGGIPNGGAIGEVLVISIYNLPMEALPVALIISTLMDPIATVLNVAGDTVSAMLVARFSEGKNWLFSSK